MDDKYDETRFAQDLEAVETQVMALLSGDSIERSLLSFDKGEPVERALVKVCAALALRHMNGSLALAVRDTCEMLLEKNRAYGDSALSPVRIFATASPMEQLLVRLDDKVSRLVRGQAAGEDVAKDLLGYLMLVLVAKKREQGSL